MGQQPNTDLDWDLKFTDFEMPDAMCRTCPILVGPASRSADRACRLVMVGCPAQGVAVSEIVFERELLTKLLAARLKALARVRRLSVREQQVLAALIYGDAPAAIADRLEITPRTVRFHTARVYEKLGVATRAELLGVVIGSSPDDASGVASSASPPTGSRSVRAKRR